LGNSICSPVEIKHFPEISSELNITQKYDVMWKEPFDGTTQLSALHKSAPAALADPNIGALALSLRRTNRIVVSVVIFAI
jgi:hypothetical protein